MARALFSRFVPLLISGTRASAGFSLEKVYKRRGGAEIIDVITRRGEIPGREN